MSDLMNINSMIIAYKLTDELDLNILETNSGCQILNHRNGFKYLLFEINETNDYFIINNYINNDIANKKNKVNKDKIIDYLINQIDNNRNCYCLKNK